jgi:hypothetical protein
VLVLLAVAAALSIFAPPLVGDLAGIVGLLTVLCVLATSFVGRTAITMSDSERSDFFRRIYALKRRWRD